MDMKTRLEEIWKSPKVACPCHIVRWTSYPTGHPYWIGSWIILRYRKGKLLTPKGPKIKGKGFSFIMKYYGEYWRMTADGVRNENE